MARKIRDLLSVDLQVVKYELIIEKFEELESNIDKLLEQIPGVEQMLAIKGIGKDTIAGFFSETIRCFSFIQMDYLGNPPESRGDQNLIFN